MNLVALKRSIPRLLMKLTKVPHPVPTDLQVSDAVHRLTGEIHKYFKEIFDNLLRIPISIADGFGNKAMAKFYSMSMAQEVSQYLFF